SGLAPRDREVRLPVDRRRAVPHPRDPLVGAGRPLPARAGHLGLAEKLGKDATRQVSWRASAREGRRRGRALPHRGGAFAFLVTQGTERAPSPPLAGESWRGEAASTEQAASPSPPSPASGGGSARAVLTSHAIPLLAGRSRFCAKFGSPAARGCRRTNKK